MIFSSSFLSTVLSIVVVLLLQAFSAVAQEAVAGYEYVGPGACRDASGNYYASYVKYYVASNADCATACEGIGEDGFRGFYFYCSSSNYCYCLFDDGM